MLDSSAVRRELASKLTEELARAGNQQAVNFRPAFQFAVEVASDTDTFRAIFRNAIRKTHESLLEGRGSGAGIDLSDSLAIISSTVQLPGTAQVGEAAAEAVSATASTTSPAASGSWVSGATRTPPR